MRRYLLFIVASLILSGISGCRPTGNLVIRNFADQYTETPKPPILQVVPFSLNDSITHIFARWQYSDLVYRKNERGILLASYSLHFEVYPDFQSAGILDSNTFVMADSLHAGSDQMCDFEFEVKAPKGKSSLLSLSLTDRNGKMLNVATFDILKSAHGSSSFFKASQEGTGLLYSPVLLSGNPVVVQYAKTTVNTLYVSLFQQLFPLPGPPFIPEERQRFNYKPDSTFLVPLKNGRTDPLHLDKKGFYFFSTDSAFREGFTLFRYSSGFPELINARQMLIPLRYITSTREFEKLNRSYNIRNAVDSFWVATAGNTDRALTLIHDYYSRVERANELFSSHLEGWQTDRGLIYIVYGTPNVVYRRNKQEEWIYGEAGNMRSLHFYFLKAENPFSAADFVLLREPAIKQAWYMAVERWRR
jgi:GWxTD domain-containing protein